MSIIENIEVAIPDQTIELDSWLKILTKIKTGFYRKLKPVISFITKKVNSPAVSFAGKGLKTECFYVEKMPISFNSAQPAYNYPNSKKPLILTKSDNGGEYLEVKYPFATYSQLNFKQLFDRVGDKIISLDHAGININPRLMPKTKYEKMKQIVSRSSYLYDFPFGKKWPFIIPASLTERQQGKIKTGVNRNPKFEFVYDFEYPYPEIQLDIQTNLSQKETLALFPKPYGYYDPTPVTGDYSINVFIYTGWAGVSLRIDLRWTMPNFDLTDFLINKGERV